MGCVALYIVLLGVSFGVGQELNGELWEPHNPHPTLTDPVCAAAAQLLYDFFSSLNSVRGGFRNVAWKRWSRTGDIYKALVRGLVTYKAREKGRVLARLHELSGIYQAIAEERPLPSSTVARLSLLEDEIQRLIGTASVNPCAAHEVKCGEQWSLLKIVSQVITVAQARAKEAVGGDFGDLPGTVALQREGAALLVLMERCSDRLFATGALDLANLFLQPLDADAVHRFLQGLVKVEHFVGVTLDLVSRSHEKQRVEDMLLVSSLYRRLLEDIRAGFALILTGTARKDATKRIDPAKVAWKLVCPELTAFLEQNFYDLAAKREKVVLLVKRSQEAAAEACHTDGCLLRYQLLISLGERLELLLGNIGNSLVGLPCGWAARGPQGGLLS